MNQYRAVPLTRDNETTTLLPTMKLFKGRERASKGPCQDFREQGFRPLSNKKILKILNEEYAAANISFTIYPAKANDPYFFNSI